MTIGEKIKRLRKEKGMTQEELGKELGLQKAAINKYENGTVVNLKRARINIIARVFCVTPSWLMNDDADWPPVKSIKLQIPLGYNAVDEKTAQMIKDHIESREIEELYLSLSDTNRAAARKYMAFLKEQQETND